MEKLLDFLVKNALGLTDYKISAKDENFVTIYELIVPSDSVGLVIGKKGRIIKMLRNLLKVKAILEKKRFNLIVTPS